MLRYSKFLLRRVAYVPWLLAAGLVLGRAEEAAAQALTVYPAYALEGSIMEFTVVLSPQPTENVTVRWDATVAASVVTTGNSLATATDFDENAGGTLTFYAGQSAIQKVYVQTTPDNLHERNEEITLALTGATPATLTIADATGVGTILNDDAAPSLSVADASGTEGGPIIFTVTLSGTVSTTNLVLDYTTSVGDDDTAAWDVDASTSTDFTVAAADASLTILAGATSAPVIVQTTHDVVDEANETFTLTLEVDTTDPATLVPTKVDTVALGTILDDDPSPSLSVADATDAEGNVLSFTVTKTPASEQAVVVSYATSDDTAISSADGNNADFTAASGMLTIPASATTGTVSVATTQDLLGEMDETFTLTLSGATNATLLDATALGTIVDNDLPSLSVADASGTEGGQVTFTVTKAGKTGGLVMVSYATAPSTATTADFTAASGTLTFQPNEESKMVSVQTTHDTVNEQNEMFTLSLSGATNATLLDPTATGTIEDNDAPLSLSVAAASGTEGGLVNFTVSLSRSVSTETVTVAYATASGTAISGTDFTAAAGMLTFTANDMSKTVPVQTTDDTVDESNETFTLTLSNPSADVMLATEMATGTIIDNDGAPSLSVAAASGTEGGLVNFTVSLSPASGQAVTVAYATAPGTATSSADGVGVDFTAASGVLTFGVGETSKLVPVLITQDNIYDPNETFSLMLSNPVGATLVSTDATATGTITDDETPPSLSVAAATGTEGEPVNFTVSLSPTSGQAVTVDYATAFGTATSADFTATSGTLVIAAGAGSGTVSVPTTNDLLNETDETFTLTLSNPSAPATLGTAMATGTIEDDASDDSITLTVNPSSVREDARATEITVRAKTPNTVTVDTYVALNLAATSVADLNSRFLITLPTLRIPKGENEAVGTITFTPIDDEIENNDLPITIEGRAGAGSVGGTTIELVDDDKASTQINLSFSDASIGKSDGTTDIVVTATLNGSTLRDDLTFALTVDEDFEGSAERDVDYTATMASITIPDRRISGRTTITIRPKNTGTGVIRVIASANPTVEGNAITVNGASIDLTGDPAKAITGLTATPFSIREDAGPKEITLEVTLQNALVTDAVVQFTISDDSDIAGDDFKGAVAAQRDVDYSASVEPLIIPKGETKGTTTMTVTPRNNNTKDDPRAFMVNARVGNNPLFSTGILITDDDTTSDSITLEVSPAQITEGAGPTAVTVTGTLQGKVFGDNVVVNLVISDDINNDGKVDANDKAATRDLDYTAILSPLVIPGGATQGIATLSITPLADSSTEGDEKIGLRSLGNPRAIDEDGDIQELTVAPVAITLKDSSAAGVTPEPIDPARPTFAAADSIANQSYTVGTAISALVLPEARGGTAPLTYSVSTLPAGLAFDATTRTLSGTPTAATAGAVTIIYTVIDSDRDASALIFSIAVEEGEMPPPVADAQLMATPSAIREDAGTTQIALTVSLAAAKAATETVTFTVVAPSEGKQAVRDVDYVASLGAVVSIPAGATVGTTTLTFTPINNSAVDDLRAVGVQATFSSGATLMTDIKIVDDETPSTAISLSVNPHAIIEGSGEVSITVTATLNGKALGENATVVIAIDAMSTATRDVDYAALFDPLIVIPAGSILGSTQFAIRIIDDDLMEGNETIKLIGVVNGLQGDAAEITLRDQAPMTPDPGDPGDSGALAFADNAAIPDQSYTAETTITPLVLPVASGGTAPLVYSVSALPAGLVFDSATRTISGTPTTVTDSAVIVIYTVIDSGGSAAVLTFSIMVNEALSLGDFFDFFGSGKIVPTASHDLAEIRDFIVGQRVEDLVLPAASGGTAPLTYSLWPALPAGLTFDAATRTIAGTPRAASESVYTYTVTDANGATASLSLQTQPTAFSLADNFPNPFNPATTIQYALPQAADVELTVYNVIGQPVRTLVAEHQSAGRYAVEWDATNDSGHSLSSGMYFYRLQAGAEFHEVKKMLLLK